MNRLAVSALLAVAVHAMLAFIAMDISRHDKIPDRSHKVQMSLGYRLAQKAQVLPKAAPPVREIKSVQQMVATAQKPTTALAVLQGEATLEKDEEHGAQPVLENEDTTSSNDATVEEIGTEISEARPLYRSNPKPAYPLQARRRGYQGTVVLEVFVDEQGKAGELRVIDSSGYNMLDDEAVRAVAGWRFEPGLIGGKPASMWVRIPVRFQLQ